MFLKTGEMKKIMKSSLKKHGLIVGNIKERYLVYSDCWGAAVEHKYASNKFKAAIMELIGDLPEEGECYEYTIDADKDLQQQAYYGYPDPYEDWMRAKDYAVAAPMYLHAWPHEYMVYQKKSDLEFITPKRSLTEAVISASELDHATESMPDRPSVLNGTVLYYKNESTIYWVHTESPGRKALEVLFPHLCGINFFEDDWRLKAGMDSEDAKEAANEQLQY